MPTHGFPQFRSDGSGRRRSHRRAVRCVCGLSISTIPLYRRPCLRPGVVIFSIHHGYSSSVKMCLEPAGAATDKRWWDTSLVRDALAEVLLFRALSFFFLSYGESALSALLPVWFFFVWFQATFVKRKTSQMITGKVILSAKAIRHWLFVMYHRDNRCHTAGTWNGNAFRKSTDHVTNLSYVWVWVGMVGRCTKISKPLLWSGLRVSAAIIVHHQVSVPFGTDNGY